MLTVLGVVSVAMALGAPAAASAKSTAQRADLVMREVTTRMTHAPSMDGADEDHLSLEELLALYDSGEQLYIRCGPQALVAQAILARNGIASRLINTLAAAGPWDNQGDGHTFLEVWIGKRWVAYDPDGNRQPVDARGRAVGAVKAAHARPFHWRYTATDPYLGAYYYPYKQLDRDLDHAMGIVAIQTSAPGEPLAFSYHVGPALRERVEGYGLANWTWVDRGQWALVTQGETGPLNTIGLASDRVSKR
jgi:hypothetical protein